MKSNLNFTNFIALPCLTLILVCASNCGTGEGEIADGSVDVRIDDTQIDTTDGGRETASLGSISGTVYSPAANLRYRFPIPKALVYLTHYEPPAIPQGSYCDKCIDIPPSIPHAYTDNHGTFKIDNVPQGNWNLVIQKGQFRRIRPVTIIGGSNLNVPEDITTLPSRNEPENYDNIPLIGVASGEYDWMEDLLAKFGLAQLGADFHYVKGTEEFTLFYNGGRAYGMGYEDFKDFLRRPYGSDDLDLSDLHILFIPCSNDHSDEVLREEEVLENIRTFVAEGGKLYVADWSYDFIEQAFPQFIEFAGDDSVVGAAEDAIEDFWDTTGTITDPDLVSWLVALGMDPTNINFLKNWIVVESTQSVAGEDEEGEPVEIIPKQYILGETPSHGTKPLNIKFNYGCGKVFYTTYHTIGALTGTPRPDLLPQEKILLYMILDISICSTDVVVPI